MRKFLMTAILVLCWISLQAKVTMPHVFSDNMVLQQQTKAAVWGKAEPGTTVNVSGSWSSETVSAVAGEDGKWIARIQTPSAGGPYELTVSDGEPIVFKNVLIGEVWLCSGQSNMDFPLRGYQSQPCNGSMEAILGARPEVPIRVCDVMDNPSNFVRDDCDCEWKENTVENAQRFSAVAYFFAEYLNRVLDVPVGLLCSNVGGTSIESWMDEDTITSGFKDEIKTAHLGTEDSRNWDTRACTNYNGMINPLLPYTLKGVIWYQGEANIGRGEQYTRLQPAFVEMLRSKFENPDMPFYYAQVAQYIYNPEKDYNVFLQEAQEKCLDLIPNSGMVVTFDVGDPHCIHPADKKTVGHRFAYLALANDYGVEGVNVQSPRFSTVSFTQGKAIIKFSNCTLGIAPSGKNLTGFEIAGEDRVFYPCTGRIKSTDTVAVTVPSEVQTPVAVRYLFHDNVTEASLYSTEGLPVAPFRSDNW